MTDSASQGVTPVSKSLSHIPGFDFISQGGLPDAATTLVTGTPGSAKTVLALQFLAEGIAKGDEAGVFVTFEERPDRVRRYAVGFNFDISAWEKAEKWRFVDASPRASDRLVETGEFNFAALIARIQHAVEQTGAKRVVLDSVSSVFSQFTDTSVVRHELFRVAEALRDLDVTAIITAERSSESQVSRHNIEDFVADNVVILRNRLEDECRRRTIEILKYRGTPHRKGEFPFTITEEGIVVIPLSEMKLGQKSTAKRISSGVEELDEMCGGGFYRDSVILVTGATGCGKTLITTEFVRGGARNDEKSLLFGFEESHDQLMRNAAGWGVDYDDLNSKGLLRVHCAYPESQSLEDHLILMKKAIEEFKPDRIVVDSLSALERVSSLRGFREFVVALTGHIKELEAAGMFTLTTSSLMGSASVTETHISSIADSIILLRYVELFGEMRRGLTMLKMRGSQHDKGIREYLIDGQGMHIGQPFRNITGILSGQPRYDSDIPGAGGDDRLKDIL